jgi:hypothetical protein
MLVKPQLSLNRLLIINNGRRVYDEYFHLGPNVIRGQNGSGKTTISDAIFHVLGGEVEEWRESAKRCDSVIAEVGINGETATLKRNIDGGKGRRPMSIFWGSYEETKSASVEEWKEYPFSSYADKESFSDVLFSALGIPSVKGDLDSQITMHQILRLMYVDQLTPYDKVFVSEQFDRQNTREVVGDLLCGVADEGLYEVQVRLSEKKEELKSIRSKIDSIKDVISNISENISIEELIQLRENVRDKKGKVYDEIENVKKNNEKKNLSEPEQSKLNSVKKDILKIRREVNDKKDRLEEIEFKIEDSKQFIDALERRREALKDASSVRKEIGLVDFRVCPSCYGPVNENSSDEQCDLCGKKVRNNGGESNNKLKVLREIEEQISESREIQEQRKEVRKELINELENLNDRLNSRQIDYDRILESVATSEESHLQDLYERVGYLNRQIEDIEEKMTLFRKLENLKDQRGSLVSDIEDLEDERDLLEERRDRRRAGAYSEIQSLLREYLARDLDREAQFEDPNEISFDFGEDEVRVNDRTNYAASSMVYLKNAFHLALFMASCKNDFFRYPRFGLFDNIEDKGMEQERSHNLQELIVEEVTSSDVECQLILTTSMVSPKLDNSKYVVGDKYTKDNKTLDL